MGNASPWCKSFCAKNPMKSGLKKYGALEMAGKVNEEKAAPMKKGCRKKY